eukprot:TRINITY_DN23715_c0_g1_i3.p1 TRINITY_DN23715_c0_g1~~TRINITY_DN23715_c0_g1_i3.p1  ORF type:complete len:415 (-),score=70.27 TRINITY_DN23715_c0_g1_i3:680-1924(-)
MLADASAVANARPRAMLAAPSTMRPWGQPPQLLGGSYQHSVDRMQPDAGWMSRRHARARTRSHCPLAIGLGLAFGVGQCRQSVRRMASRRSSRPASGNKVDGSPPLTALQQAQLKFYGVSAKGTKTGAARAVEAEKPTKTEQRHGRDTYIFWDLDNLRPAAGVSLNACVAALAEEVLADERCGCIKATNIYANKVTLARAYFLPGKEDGDTDAPHQCPICGCGLQGDSWARASALRKHHLQHYQEVQKEAALRSSNLQRKMGNRLFTRTSGQEIRYLGSLRGGETPRPELIKEKVSQLDTARCIAVPPYPQAVDIRLLKDVTKLVKSKYAARQPGVICLVSDDIDFAEKMSELYDAGWQIKIVGSTSPTNYREISRRPVYWTKIVSQAAAKMSQPSKTSEIFFDPLLLQPAYKS